MNNKNIKYEMGNFKGIFTTTIIISIIFQIIIFSFFFSVGLFDRESSDEIFEHYNSLLGFTNLFSSLMVSIYISVRSCKYIVSSYMSDNKMRLYLFPNGRGKLFINKISGFFILTTISELVGIMICNILCIIILSFTNLLPSDLNIVKMIVVTISTILFALFGEIISVIIGTRFSSKVSTILTSIIMAAIMCNPLSFLCAYSSMLSFTISIILIVISLFAVLYCKHYIDNDELIKK